MNRIIAGPGPRLPQFSLSTAVVLMLVAALLLWANLRPTWRGVSLMTTRRGLTSYGHGWPDQMMWSSYTFDTNEVEFNSSEEEVRDYLLRKNTHGPYYRYRPEGIVTNVLVALAILTATYFLCNRWHRKVARKDPKHFEKSAAP